MRLGAGLVEQLLQHLIRLAAADAVAGCDKSGDAGVDRLFHRWFS
jgi:hypothetical protein